MGGRKSKGSTRQLLQEEARGPAAWGSVFVTKEVVGFVFGFFFFSFVLKYSVVPIPGAALFSIFFSYFFFFLK